MFIGKSITKYAANLLSTDHTSFFFDYSGDRYSEFFPNPRLTLRSVY